MKKMTALLLSAMTVTSSYAGEAENIQSCIDRAKEFSGVTLNAFQVTYQGNILSMSTASWKNAQCEVKLGHVYNLNVNNKRVIYDGYAGKESFDRNEELQKKTDDAVAQLKTRISLLEQRMKSTKAALQAVRPNHAALTSYVDEGIQQALGQKSEAPQSNAPTKAIKIEPPPPPAPPPPKQVEPAESLPATIAASAQKLYIRDKIVDVRLGPSNSSKSTNRIYYGQVVEVYESKGKWHRVSEYYDGAVEGQSGKVARWITVDGFSKTEPPPLAEPRKSVDPRIAKDAIPNVGSGGLTAKDVDILYRAAQKFLDSGKCARIEMGDKSLSKPNTYYLNCGGPNFFFTPSDL